MERRPDEASSSMSGGREAKHLPAVVVGVDGSAGSREALQWAIAEARLREVPLRAIHAWTYAQPLITSDTEASAVCCSVQSASSVHTTRPVRS
jgi:Universal stress protein family